MDKWSDFYATRVNSQSYEKYFKKRYAVLLNTILNLNPKYVWEDGVGIGSIMKALPLEIPCGGCDISVDMLNLANTNNFERSPLLSEFDILNNFRSTESLTLNRDSKSYGDGDNNDHIIVSHGVLEHFSDNDIIRIIDNQKSYRPKNIIHYVPTDKYNTPSFGDERLLPVSHWVELTDPIAYDTFNEGHDLIMIY